MAKMESESDALNRQKGKTVKSIQHHEIIGVLEIHLKDGSCVSVQANGKADTRVMIIEPSN